MKTYDVIIIGAGAAGLMAAISAGKRGKKTLLLERTNKIGEKIRISGGGRCNFTNLTTGPKNFLSNNPSFVISPLARFTQHDFIAMVESYNIAYHEKTLGQLFCNEKATQIINMLLEECKKYKVEISLNCEVQELKKADYFQLFTNLGPMSSISLIVATGGLSIPKIGGSDFGYRIASQFGLKIIPTRPALVPLTADEDHLRNYKDLSGVSAPTIVTYEKTQFRENILFTHKGLSGPAILQISSYLKSFKDQAVKINFLPDIDIDQLLQSQRTSKISLANFLKTYLPHRLVDKIIHQDYSSKRLIDCNKMQLAQIAHTIRCFNFQVEGSEGYDKAEVTAGGVDTNELSSKTMMSNKVPNLYFIGEVVDVTGWLGGYNFQWAWSSGFSAGNNA
jgi:predicted Rossmann fold flavoprotein